MKEIHSRGVKMESVPVSVIIPNFNSGEFLRECISSINVSTRPVEIIIVDDCSTDGSLDIALEFSRQHDNVRVVRLESNGGSVAARWSGIVAATQPWIAFVDADDFLEAGAIGNAYDRAVESGADLCIWQLWREDHGKQWHFIPLEETSFPKSGEEALMMTLGSWRIHPLGVSKKSLYIEAYEGFDGAGLNADELITRIAFSLANKVVLCEKRYFYRVNHQSMTLAVHPRRLTALDSALWLLKFCKRYPNAPIGDVGLSALRQAWGLWKLRSEIGAMDVRAKLRTFLPELRSTSGLVTWIWRHPRLLLAYIIMCVATGPSPRRSNSRTAS